MTEVKVSFYLKRNEEKADGTVPVLGRIRIGKSMVDNDGKTISDRNDRYRNEKVCKQLKDKYNLTYGQGKENVNVQKLKGAEQTKYEIYHAIKDTLPKVKDWKQFEDALKYQGISIARKYKGDTDEVQGISFRKGEHSFKGSEIDRKFSYS